MQSLQAASAAAGSAATRRDDLAGARPPAPRAATAHCTTPSVARGRAIDDLGAEDEACGDRAAAQPRQALRAARARDQARAAPRAVRASPRARRCAGRRRAPARARHPWRRRRSRPASPAAAARCGRRAAGCAATKAYIASGPSAAPCAARHLVEVGAGAEHFLRRSARAAPCQSVRDRQHVELPFETRSHSSLMAFTGGRHSVSVAIASAMRDVDHRGSPLASSFRPGAGARAPSRCAVAPPPPPGWPPRRPAGRRAACKRWILPVAVLGRLSTNSIQRGYFQGPIVRLTCTLSSS